MADPVNPYLPDRGEQLAMLLMAMGSGVTNAEANGRSGWAGVPMGAALFAQGLGQARQQALEADRWQKQYGEQEAYRKAQEENLKSQVEERRRQADIDQQLIGRLPGMGATAPTAPAAVPGFAPPVAKPTLGPGADYFARTGAAENNGSYAGANRMGSGAWGKYQFMPDTWADVAAKNPQLGLPFNMRQATPEQQEAAMRAFTASNGQALRMAGIAATPDTLYLAHRFGAEGAKTVLSARPGTAIASLFPAQWAEQNPDMRGVTVDQFRQGARQRMAGAPMPFAQGDGGPPGSPGTSQQPPYAAPTAPRVDPLAYAPFTLSKRLAPFGKAMIDIGNADRTYGLDERKFQQSIDQDTEKRQQFERSQTGTERNQRVGPDGQPNAALLDAETEAERRKLGAELDTKAATALVTDAVKNFTEKERPKALALQETIPQIHNLRRLINGGAMTGPGVGTRNFLMQLGRTIGVTPPDDATTLTPSYLAALATQLTANAKSLGVNPTDRDAQIIKEAQGANPDTSKDAMLRLLDVNENLQRQAHARYLAEAKRIQGLRGVKQAYGDDYFALPSPPTYDDWLKENPLPGGMSKPVNSLDAEMDRRGLTGRPSTPTGNALDDELKRRGLK